MRMEVLLSLSGSQRQKKKPTHHIGRCGFRVHGKAIRPCRHPDKNLPDISNNIESLSTAYSASARAALEAALAEAVGGRIKWGQPVLPPQSSV